ncbi:MAG: hypothetical protein RLZZ182_1607, partial [Pseudomonadota bacterium]
MKSVDRAHWMRQWALTTALLALLAALATAGQWLWRLDQSLYDASLSLFQRPAPSSIVLIRIDDASIRALGRWPWPRAVHATLLDHLQASEPRSVLLNLLLSEPSDEPLQDEVLARAMARSGKVVLPVSPLATDPQAPTLADAPSTGVLLPLPLFREQASLGHADVPIDADGVVRQLHLRAGPGLASYPHLAEALMTRAGERLPLGLDTVRSPLREGLQRHWVRDEQLALRYGGPHQWIPSVSYVDVLKGQVSPETFRHKHVLVGVTAMGLGTQFTTPLSSQGETLSGTELAGQALAMLQSGNLITMVSWGASATLAALGTLCLMWAIWRLPPRLGLIVALSTMLLAACAAMLALGLAGLWCPPGGFMLTALLCYPVWSWRRLELSQRAMRSTADDLTQGLPEHLIGPHPAGHAGDAMARSLDQAQRAAQRLQQHRRQLEELLATLPVAVFVIDAQGQIEASNPLALALLNRPTPSSVHGRPLAVLLHGFKPMEATSWDALFQQGLQATASLAGEIQGPEQSVHWACLTPCRSLVHEGPALMLSMMDVTRLRLAERQREDLLGFIAHDIRSPQASLVSLVEMHQLGLQQMPLDTLMETVDTLARNTIDLCEELLLVMRSESMPLLTQDCSPVDLIDEALAEVLPRAQARQVRLSVDSQAWHGDPVRVDPTQWRRVLVNLLGNAVKFSPEGGRVCVRLTQDIQGIHTAIEDQGPGIRPEDLARLFRRYQRLDHDPRLRMATGVGLGLVYV